MLISQQRRLLKGKTQSHQHPGSCSHMENSLIILIRTSASKNTTRKTSYNHQIATKPSQTKSK